MRRLVGSVLAVLLVVLMIPSCSTGSASSSPSLTSGERPLPPGENGGERPEPPDGKGGFGGSSSAVEGESANTIDEDGTYTSETYTSTGDDENALLVDGATVTLDSVTVEKNGGSSSNTENGDFYGINAALLVKNGGEVTILDSVISSSARNGNGVFSYGSGTVVTIKDSTITTTEDNSGGIQTTGGGTTYGYDLTVTTEGNSSAAIRSDRGGGTVVVEGGSYTSCGYNSPAVYSTADITITDAELTALNSEALVIEGKNSITLYDSVVSGNMSDTEGTSSSENVHNIMIYQSMSGDADVGLSSFSVTGGSITGKNGDMFYITNTSADITLTGVTVMNEDEDGYLFNITGNSGVRGWGNGGENGADVTVTLSEETIEGDIRVDGISTLNLTLTGNTVFTGSIAIDENTEGGSTIGNNVTVTVEEGSVWILSSDSGVSSIVNNGTIDFNGYTLTLSDGTVLM